MPTTRSVGQRVFAELDEDLRPPAPLDLIARGDLVAERPGEESPPSWIAGRSAADFARPQPGQHSERGFSRSNALLQMMADDLIVAVFSLLPALIRKGGQALLEGQFLLFSVAMFLHGRHLHTA